MNINARQLINKKTGKLLYDSFVPRPLQEIEQELVFSFDIFDKLIQVNNLLSKLNKFINSKEDVSEDFQLLVRIESLYACNIPELKTSTDSRQLIFSCYKNLPSGSEKYAKAVHYGIAHMDELVFSLPSVMILYKMLMEGETDTLGLRTVSRPFSILKRDSEVPTAPEEVEEALTSLLSYMDNPNKAKAVIRSGLIIYQLMTISPFERGNFRLANLLSNLYLLKNGVISNFVMFTSTYFCYYFQDLIKHFEDIRKNGNFEAYILYYLEAMETAAEMLLDRLTNIADLHQQNLSKIMNSEYSKTIKMHLINVLKFLKNNPIATIKDACQALDKTNPTIDNAYQILSELGILSQLGCLRRNRVYIYDDVLHNLSI